MWYLTKVKVIYLHPLSCSSAIIIINKQIVTIDGESTQENWLFMWRIDHQSITRRQLGVIRGGMSVLCCANNTTRHLHNNPPSHNEFLMKRLIKLTSQLNFFLGRRRSPTDQQTSAEETVEIIMEIAFINKVTAENPFKATQTRDRWNRYPDWVEAKTGTLPRCFSQFIYLKKAHFSRNFP